MVKKQLIIDEFKNLIKEYYALEKLFVNFQNSQVLRDDSLEGTTDDFKATITNFNEDINNWDVSNVTDMNGMFAETKKFDQPLNHWDVSNVITMEHMFSRALTFNHPVYDWNIPNLKNVDNMFVAARSYTYPLIELRNTDNQLSYVLK